MLNRTRILITVVWILSLAVVARWSNAEANAQRADPMTLQQAVVYSGSDLGFRVSQPLAEPPVGRFVVRMNGQWKEVEVGPARAK